MIESPLIQELVAEDRKDTIVVILTERFGSEAESVSERLQCLQDIGVLKELVREAVRCDNLASFRAKLDQLA